MATQRKKSKTKLPRLTVLALSARELLRFTEAVEQLVSVSRDLTTLFNRYDATLCKLEAAAEVLDRRDRAAFRRTGKRPPAMDRDTPEDVETVP